MYREAKVITIDREYIICGETSDDSFVVLENEENDCPCIGSGTFMECLNKVCEYALKEK